MLNLSDKELDRLSRQAAQEHDPGDVLGSRSWEKLEPLLDRDLGKPGPNPLHAVRRFPFYYVPAILLVAGVFYFVKQGHRSEQAESTGSPPSTAAQSTPATTTQPLSSQNPEHSINSTPTVTTPAATDPAMTKPVVTDPAATNSVATNPTATNPAATNPGTNPATGRTSPLDHSGKTVHYPGSLPASETAAANTAAPNAAPNTASNTNNSTVAATNNNSTATNNRSGANIAPAHTTSRNNRSRNNLTNSHNHGLARTTNHPGGTTNSPGAINSTTDDSQDLTTTSNTGSTQNTAQSTNSTTSSGANQPTNTTHELTLSRISRPHSLGQRAPINDSALRAYKAPASTIELAKNKSMRINRTLQFGLTIAPDFSSVNSLAGDRPGSTFGLTLDYQFAHRWYLSTGLLLDRKNYAARAQDYHAPIDYYQFYNLHNIEFVKGTLSMLEIPLNLRYDFSTTGNTLFFASAGLSTYLLTNENSNYYFHMFGQEYCRSFSYSNDKNYLFSSINLSLGVETGISDDLSLLIAPYVKLPSRNIGFGQMQMNSVGISFALKFAPVISRKRK